VIRGGAPAAGSARPEEDPGPGRTPFRVEVTWATGYGLFCLAVAVAGFVWFLDRLRDL
jgi:hypothetical protein